MATKVIGSIRGKGMWVTAPNGQKVWYPKGSRVNKTKPVFQQGKGVRLQVRYLRDIRHNPRLIKIKQNQIRAERREDIRVGTGLFDDPLNDHPKVIGVTKQQRKRQKNPHSQKLKRKGTTGTGRRGRQPKQHWQGLRGY